MKFELHPACAAWPEMNPNELQDLADDIKTHGLRDPITLTPDGLLLDGRNRALACEIVGVEPPTEVYHGDPWLYSLSRNKHRRHMTTDQIAMVAAKLATLEHGGDRRSGDFKTSNEGLKSVSKIGEAAGVPETAIDSAKVVLKYGTPDEMEAVESGKAKLRKTADAARARRRADVKPDRPSVRRAARRIGKKIPIPSRDPIDDVTRELITKCAGPKSEWRTLDRMSSTSMLAKSAINPALTRLGEAVETRTGEKDIEYLINGDPDALLVRAGLMGAQAELGRSDSHSVIADLRAANDDLRKRLADAQGEIETLRAEIGRAGEEIERLERALRCSELGNAEHGHEADARA